MRPVLRTFAFALLRWSGLPFLFREMLQRRRVTIILYHDPKPEVLEEHFQILKSRYNIIPLQEYVQARRTGNLHRLPLKPLVITLDDGSKGNYALLPVLRRHDVPVTIFLCSGVVGTCRHFWFEHDMGGYDLQLLKAMPDERRLEILRRFGWEETKEFPNRIALSKEEVEEMKQAVDFQSHTRFHPLLPRCSAEKAYAEIRGSREDLHNEYGLDIYALAFPNGDYTEREIAMASEAGYECAVTVEAGFNGPDTDLFRLKRLGLTDEAGVNELLVKVSGLWSLKAPFKGSLKAPPQRGPSGPSRGAIYAEPIPNHPTK